MMEDLRRESRFILGLGRIRTEIDRVRVHFNVQRRAESAALSDRLIIDLY